jgi:hypothetical protein
LHLGQLSFALGTPIPLFLEILNDGAVYVDTDEIDVRLVRTLTARSVTGGVHKLDVARAVFWRAPGSSTRRMKLFGEVIAGKGLTPGFVFSKCSVQVCALSPYVLVPVDMNLWYMAVLHRALSWAFTRTNQT